MDKLGSSRKPKSRRRVLGELGFVAIGFLGSAMLPALTPVAQAQENGGNGTPTQEECPPTTQETINRVAATAPTNWRCENGDYAFDSTPGTYTLRQNFEDPCPPEDENHTSSWNIVGSRVDPDGNMVIELEEQSDDGTVLDTTEYTPTFCCGG